MRLLKLINSMHFRTDSHQNLFKKYATHAMSAIMGAPHSDCLLQCIGEAKSIEREDFAEHKILRAKGERIESLKFLKNVNTIGDYQNA